MWGPRRSQVPSSPWVPISVYVRGRVSGAPGEDGPLRIHLVHWHRLLVLAGLPSGTGSRAWGVGLGREEGWGGCGGVWGFLKKPGSLPKVVVVPISHNHPLFDHRGGVPTYGRSTVIRIRAGAPPNGRVAPTEEVLPEGDGVGPGGSPVNTRKDVYRLQSGPRVVVPDSNKDRTGNSLCKVRVRTYVFCSFVFSKRFRFLRSFRKEFLDKDKGTFAGTV